MITVQKAAELTGHSNPIFALTLSQKPDILFTGGNDKGVVEWSLKTNSFIKVMFPVISSVYAIHCPEDYPFMFTGLRNGEVLIFDFIKQQLLPGLRHHRKPVFDIKSVNSKKELLVASEDGSVSIWNMDTLQLVHTIKISADTVRAISISPNEKQVAFGCRDSNIQVYDLEDYTHIGTLSGHSMAVFSTQYSPDGSYLVTGSRDAQVKIWDTTTFELITNIPAHLFAVNHISFHPDRPYFATASMDKTIKLWGADDFKLYKVISREKGYETHFLSVNKLTWHNSQLLSTGDDKRVIIWDIAF
ncbi:WD40 repeat domain-containing protein [Mucilaginibacter sp. dw_454]|uniref:WD40 repeat domain-containing protein n=1 Tax=Mucilaginibacter sp. dw_454 TaxID=2720079 RepID=UPI001BD52E8D|nr:WD40 repeat domain-containing protein [Mucilaginibacter sp. dw_454]